jgi:hypothetical protein
MQVDGKHEDKKENYHMVLVLERLLRYMFKKDFGVLEKKTTET